MNSEAERTRKVAVNSHSLQGKNKAFLLEDAMKKLIIIASLTFLVVACSNVVRSPEAQAYYQQASSYLNTYKDAFGNFNSVLSEPLNNPALMDDVVWNIAGVLHSPFSIRVQISYYLFRPHLLNFKGLKIV